MCANTYKEVIQHGLAYTCRRRRQNIEGPTVSEVRSYAHLQDQNLLGFLFLVARTRLRQAHMRCGLIFQRDLTLMCCVCFCLNAKPYCSYC